MGTLKTLAPISSIRYILFRVLIDDIESILRGSPVRGFSTAERLATRGSHSYERPSEGPLPFGLPAGNRRPRGKSCWYLASVPSGFEIQMSRAIQFALDSGLADRTIPAMRELWFSRGGVWSLIKRPLFQGYILLRAKDPIGLNRILEDSEMPVQIVSALGHRCMPISDEVGNWIYSSIDESSVLRSSVAVIRHGELRVLSGPLVDREAGLDRIDRHRRSCMAYVSGDASHRGYAIKMALEIPYKD